MTTYPEEFRYTKEHEWVKAEGGVGVVGITDHAQQELGDIVYVDLPKVGTKLEQGKSLGSVESVKAVSDIYSPVSGEVIEINDKPVAKVNYSYRATGIREPRKASAPAAGGSAAAAAAGKGA